MMVPMQASHTTAMHGVVTGPPTLNSNLEQLALLLPTVLPCVLPTVDHFLLEAARNVELC